MVEPICYLELHTHHRAGELVHLGQVLRPAGVGPHCPHLPPLDCEREGALARVGAGAGHEQPVLTGDMGL